MYCVTVKRSGGEKNLEKFYKSLKKFSQESNFNDFFNENKGYYEDIVNYAASKIKDEDNIIEEMEKYYGMKRESYNVVLISLYGKIGYASTIRYKGDGFIAYSFLGSNGILQGKPYFGSSEGFKNLVRHEISHSFVNLTTEKYWDEAKKYDCLLNSIKDDMEEKSYGTWMYCLNEHIVRAITSRLIYLGDEDLGKEALEHEKSIGFIYVDKLFEKLKEYEENRCRYPTFESFYPELIKSLKYYIENS